MEPINVGIKTIQDEKCLADDAKVIFLVVKREKKIISECNHCTRLVDLFCAHLYKNIFEINLVLNGMVRSRFYNRQSLFISNYKITDPSENPSRVLH